MVGDTRSKNTYFDQESIGAYINEYAESIASTLKKVDKSELEKAFKILKSSHRVGGRIFVGGNGGSSAIADHLTCDFTKGTFTERFTNLQSYSLNSMPLFSAIGNDCGYEHTLAFQLELYDLKGNDVVILISSSGTSKNIVKAGEFAKTRGAWIIGLSGFDGGYLRAGANCSASLHVDVNNYGVIEDCHQALMHILAQYYYLSLHE